MTKHSLSPALSWVLTLSGLAGLGASWALMIDKLALLENPDFVAACDVNSFITCTSVMESPVSEFFGFPNQMLGLISFVVVVTIGVLALTKTEFPQWIVTGLWLGALLGIISTHALAYHSIFVLGLLCPWCMVVWAAMILVFSYLSLDRLKAWQPDSTITNFVTNWSTLIVALWFLAHIAAIVLVFF